MGMGEPKIPYVPKYDPVRCDVTGKMFTPGAVSECPEPNVIKRYGVGGVAHVCVYVCRRCKYVKTYPFFGGVSCGYKLELSSGKGGDH